MIGRQDFFARARALIPLLDRAALCGLRDVPHLPVEPLPRGTEALLSTAAGAATAAAAMARERHTCGTCCAGRPKAGTISWPRSSAVWSPAGTGRPFRASVSRHRCWQERRGRPGKDFVHSLGAEKSRAATCCRKRAAAAISSTAPSAACSIYETRPEVCERFPDID